MSDFPTINDNDKVFLIWSNRRQLWWKDNFSYYTSDVRQAGRYSLQQARQICNTLNLHTTNAGPDSALVIDDGYASGIYE